ncbi:MAG TPA: hypothetical protein VFS02_08005, partial [Telluria sp.]|nr:hypothetical protein [Telluria sp.]
MKREQNEYRLLLFYIYDRDDKRAKAAFPAFQRGTASFDSGAEQPPILLLLDFSFRASGFQL